MLAPSGLTDARTPTLRRQPSTALSPRDRGRGTPRATPPDACSVACPDKSSASTTAVCRVRGPTKSALCPPGTPPASRPTVRGCSVSSRTDARDDRAAQSHLDRSGEGHEYVGVRVSRRRSRSADLPTSLQSVQPAPSRLRSRQAASKPTLRRGVRGRSGRLGTPRSTWKCRAAFPPGSTVQPPPRRFATPPLTPDAASALT